jgi:glutamate synthase domain-containing protein 3
LDLYAIDNCQTLLPKPMQTADVVCNLREPTEMELVLFESMSEHKEAQKLNAVNTTLSDLDALCHQFEAEKTQILNTLDSAQHFFACILRKESQLEKNCENAKSVPNEEVQKIV